MLYLLEYEGTEKEKEEEKLYLNHQEPMNICKNFITVHTHYETTKL